MKGRSISYSREENLGSGRARAGRPVQIRTDGFAVDINYLGRLRTAIVMDRKLPAAEKTQTLGQLDALVESLARLTEQRAVQKSA
jgi:hypothetical protein